MTDYEWLTEMGLCHKCRKNKVAPHRKFCFDCLDKIREINSKRYDSEKAKEYQERRREIYRQKKENGICVRCNKKATHGMYCIDCYLKVKRHNTRTSERRKYERHKRGNIIELRRKNFICIRCESKLTDEDIENKYQLCKTCRSKLKEAGMKGNVDSPFRIDERNRYDKNRRWKNEHIHTALQETE